MKQILFICCILVFSSFIQNQEDEINALFAKKKYQECANFLNNLSKDNKYVHYNHTYKLASCYAYLNKQDSAYFNLKKIINYFNSLDGLVSINNISIDYASFKELTNTSYWDKITKQIKKKAVKDHFYNKEKDTIALKKIIVEKDKIDSVNIKKVISYIENKKNKNAAIDYNWSIINNTLHQSASLEQKEKYLPLLYENTRLKKLDAYAFTMFYMRFLEQKNGMKIKNFNAIKDSVINSFNH
jgi:hypothetical protein